MARSRADFGQGYQNAGAYLDFTPQVKSLQFDGTFQLTSIASALVGVVDTWTLAIWAKSNRVDPPATRDGLAGFGGDPNFEKNKFVWYGENASGGDLTAGVLNDSQVSRQFMTWNGAIDNNTDTWHQYIHTWDGTAGGAVQYIDAVDTAPTSTFDDLDSTGLIDAARHIVVGARTKTDANEEWLGPIYSFSIWNSVLTQDEVTDIYNGGNPVPINLQGATRNYVSSSNLIHHYRLGFGNTAAEIGRDHVGTHHLDASPASLDVSDLTSDVPS